MTSKKRDSEPGLHHGVSPALGGNVDGVRIIKNWGGSNWNFYMNDADGKTVAINLGPTSSSVDYNLWTGNDNIAQVRYGSYSYSYYYYLKNHFPPKVFICRCPLRGIPHHLDYTMSEREMAQGAHRKHSDGS